jgi:hypothetical protein
MIRERKHFQNLFRVDRLFEYINPILQIAIPVDDGLVPSLRLGLDALTVARPTDISPVSRC